MNLVRLDVELSASQWEGTLLIYIYKVIGSIPNTNLAKKNKKKHLKKIMG